MITSIELASPVNSIKPGLTLSIWISLNTSLMIYRCQCRVLSKITTQIEINSALAYFQISTDL